PGMPPGGPGVPSPDNRSGGFAGRIPGLGGGGAAPGEEAEIAAKNLDDKDLDGAKLAESITPLRMVVVYGTVPYKEQVLEYQRALRAQMAEALQGTSELPQYHSYNVEREVWSLDGKERLQEWTKLDLTATLADLFFKTIEFEDDFDPKFYEAVKK